MKWFELNQREKNIILTAAKNAEDVTDENKIRIMFNYLGYTCSHESSDNLFESMGKEIAYNVKYSDFFKGIN